MLNKLIISISFTILLTSCNFGGGVSVRYNFPSIGEGSAPSNSEYFYVDLDTDQYKSEGDSIPFYEMSTTTEYGDAEERNSLSNCEIFYSRSDSDEELDERIASEENLICILDLLEYEFVNNEVHIVYNVPGRMCDYIKLSLPWHFNHEILEGPDVEECGSDDEEDDESGFRIVGQSNCVEDEEDLCPASATIDEEAVRCCSRGRKSDGSEWEPDLECFGGPSLIAESRDHDTEEFHRNILISPKETGENESITLTDLISINGAEERANVGVSSPFANYLEMLDREPERLKDLNRSSLPDFLQRSPYYDHTPNLFFEFACLDIAGETLHRILLMIREWNTFEEFREFYNAGGDDSSDPDIEGEEGKDCDYEDFTTLDEEIEPCNDLLDLDNIASCSDSAWCAIFNRNDRIFPRISYSESSDSSE